MSSPATAARRTDDDPGEDVELGLRANWRQFALLVTVNVFVGGMVGLERTVLLGVGTAMVYPALLAAVGDTAHPAWRATSVGVYRSWRDIGYAVGVVIAGVVAGLLSLTAAVHAAAALTFVSGLVAWRTVRETTPAKIEPSRIHAGRPHAR